MFAYIRKTDGSIVLAALNISRQQKTSSLKGEDEIANHWLYSSFATTKESFKHNQRSLAPFGALVV